MTVAPPSAGFAVVGEIILDQAVFDELRVLGEGAEDDFLTELVDNFFAETERLLVRAREAVDARDADAVGRIAHSIRGSCGQLGGRRLAASCRVLGKQADTGGLSGNQTDLHHVELDYEDLRGALTQHLSSVRRSRA